MTAIDEDWFLNRTFCGVAILSSLVIIGAAVSRYRLKKKKNTNPYYNRFTIFMASPFFGTYFGLVLSLIVSMARFHFASTVANGPSTL
jgi:hypothetical protein